MLYNCQSQLTKIEIRYGTSASAVLWYR